VFEDRSGEALADLYHAADMLVLPSYSEGFPLVVQEAMACGTPPLVSPQAAVGAPGARAWLYTCMLSPAASACSRWKAALLEILGNSAFAKRREATAVFARNEWTWESCVVRYVELFERLARKQ
jgi:glycosyltransferase involved in cell wall biosynthesis